MNHNEGWKSSLDKIKVVQDCDVAPVKNWEEDLHVDINMVDSLSD